MQQRHRRWALQIACGWRRLRHATLITLRRLQYATGGAQSRPKAADACNGVCKRCALQPTNLQLLRRLRHATHHHIDCAMRSVGHRPVSGGCSSVYGATSGGQVGAGYATPLIIRRLQSMEHRPPASGHCVQRRAHEGDVCSDMGCGQGFGYRHSPLNRMQYAVEWLAREAAR